MIDEASLAGTFTLDELVSAATTGRFQDLACSEIMPRSASVEAGGAFSLLVKDRGDLVPELTDVRRFSSEWEKAASVELRLGNKARPSTPTRPTTASQPATGRVLLDAIYAAWKADVEAGKSSLMIAGDTATVTELNRRARADRVAEGTVAESGLAIADGQTAGVGDEIVTRQNNRLADDRKELGEERRPLRRHRHQPRRHHGSAPRLRRRRGRAARRLRRPARRARLRHDRLSQPGPHGRHHALAGLADHDPRGALRRRDTRARVQHALRRHDASTPIPPPDTTARSSPQTASEVLAGVLANEGADLSAHETLERAQRQAEDFSVLAAEYETLARAAQQQRWDELLDRSGLEPDRLEQVRQSPAYGPLLAALRDAEARGLDVERDLPRGSSQLGRSMTPRTPPRSSATESTVGHRPPDRRGERARTSSQG